MIMWAILLFVAIAQVCDPSRNGEGSNIEGDLINPECNLAGVCWDWDRNGSPYCRCCGIPTMNDYCGHVIGYYEGGSCDRVRYFTQVSVSILFAEGLNVSCLDDGESAAVPSYKQGVSDSLQGYTGLLLELECEICSVTNICQFEDGPDADSGILAKFGTDLNTYYDHGCGQDTLPGSNVRPCPSNHDYGITAHSKMLNAIDDENDFESFLDAIRVATGYTSGEITQMSSSETFISTTTVRNTRLPTPKPTTKPTSGSPTKSPLVLRVEEPYCEGYVNNITNFRFMAVGSSCRGNINESWPGGQTCESPYIICLPQENTPAMPFMNRTYFNNTHRYTVNQCLQECAYDQRCMGIEFEADTNSIKGNCTLLDDIDIRVVDIDYEYTYNPKETNLDATETGGVLCWSKDNYCNPYFEAEDLNEEMLNCYCPNNRKGSYTKKVQRTVDNTRFCGNDSSVDERIKKAQANRMFHMCENWCLFETTNPEQESWYWDPWQKCWRETYSGTGAHRAYCDRVIRNPDSIELQFVNSRSERFCEGTMIPTKSPVEDFNTTYFLSLKAESCDDACARNNKTCAADQTTRVFSSESDLVAAFAQANYDCEYDNVVMNRSDFAGWALPGVANSVCVNRQPPLPHLEDLDSDCNRILGAKWQRLCACF